MSERLDDTEVPLGERLPRLVILAHERIDVADQRIDDLRAWSLAHDHLPESRTRLSEVWVWAALVAFAVFALCVADAARDLNARLTAVEATCRP